jgi:hypothetical protein
MCGYMRLAEHMYFIPNHINHIIKEVLSDLLIPTPSVGHNKEIIKGCQHRITKGIKKKTHFRLVGVATSLYGY